MTELLRLGIERISLMKANDRKLIDPSEYFGFEQEIVAAKEDPKAAMKHVLIVLEVPWDVAKPMTDAVLDELKTRCRTNRSISVMHVDDHTWPDITDAVKILLSKKCGGVFSVATIEKASARVLLFVERYGDVLKDANKMTEPSIPNLEKVTT